MPRRRKAMEETGMSDMQFKSYLRELIASLEKAKEGDDPKGEIEQLIARLKKSLED